MATWSSFYAHLRPHLPGCSDLQLDKELCTAAGEFFKRSRAWRAWLAPVPALAGVRSYTIPVPEHSHVLQIERATAGGVPIDVESYTLYEVDPTTAAGLDPGLSSSDRVTFLMSREVAADTPIQIEATLFPAETATGIADALFHQYREAIANGAKARLMLTPGRTYSNPTLGALADGQFEAAINAAHASVYLGHVGKTPRLRPTWC